MVVKSLLDVRTDGRCIKLLLKPPEEVINTTKPNNQTNNQLLGFFLIPHRQLSHTVYMYMMVSLSV